MKMDGCWRAVVVNDMDPEKRGRCQVRIPQLHPEALDDAHCPWAEIAAYGGRKPGNGVDSLSFGDLPIWHVGDIVFVMFEGGETRYPVILGGWFTETAYPQEVRDAYAEFRQRRRITDRAGNYIEMDERPASKRLYFQAGDTSVELNQTTKVITVKTTDQMLVQAPNVRVDATDVVVNTGTAAVNASGSVQVEAGGAVSVQGASVTVIADGTLNVQAAGGMAFTTGPVNFISPSFHISSMDIGFSSPPHVP